MENLIDQRKSFKFSAYLYFIPGCDLNKPLRMHEENIRMLILPEGGHF